MLTPRLLLLLLPLVVDAFAPPPLFTVNLSAPARQRWKGALAKVLAVHEYDFSFKPVFEAHNQSLFNKLSSKDWEVLENNVEQHWPERAEELKGLAEDFAAVGHPEVTFRYLTGWVWFHSLAHTDALNRTLAPTINRECTALLARDAQGHTMHVGNMDQSPEAVRNCTLRIRFVDGAGKVVFEGVDWYWVTTGVTRAVRAGVASLQENWRSYPAPTPLSKTLAFIASGTPVPQVWVFRDLLTQEPPPPNFAAVSAHLEHVPLAAPYYAIAAGPGGEGVVMARNETGSELTSILGVDADAKAFLVQTNYDRDQKDPSADPRRTYAESMLSSLVAADAELGSTRHLSFLDLFGTASAYPVHNPHTAYTAVMDPVTGSLSAYVRDALCPIDYPLAKADQRYCAAK